MPTVAARTALGDIGSPCLRRETNFVGRQPSSRRHRRRNRRGRGGRSGTPTEKTPPAAVNVPAFDRRPVRRPVAIPIPIPIAVATGVGPNSVENAADHRSVDATEQFEPELDLYDKVWPIYTHQEQLAPAKFIHDDAQRRGMALNSMVSGGCIVSGANIKNSVLFSKVVAHSYSHIEDSVVLPEVSIGRHSKIRRAIIDGGCVIPEKSEIGYDKQKDTDAGFRVTESGITLVTPDSLGQSLHRTR